MRSRARPGVSAATVVLIVVGIASAGGLTAMLVRVAARERERSERSETGERTARTELETSRHRLREAEERVRRQEDERARREAVVEGETARLRRELADALGERDRLQDRYRAAAVERDRSVEDLMALRRDVESLRTDLARMARRAGDGEAAAAERAKRLEETRKRLDDVQARVPPLLRLLLEDLRSADGSVRVRAHEALCAFASRQFPFRQNGTAEEREADAAAMAAVLLPAR